MTELESKPCLESTGEDGPTRAQVRDLAISLHEKGFINLDKSLRELVESGEGEAMVRGNCGLWSGYVLCYP